MTTHVEITLRFESPEAVDRILMGILSEEELATAKRVISGLYFTTARSFNEVMDEIFEDGFEMEDFTSFEVRPVRTV